MGKRILEIERMLKVIADEQKVKLNFNTHIKEPKLDVTMEDIDP